MEIIFEDKIRAMHRNSRQYVYVMFGSNVMKWLDFAKKARVILAKDDDGSKMVVFKNGDNL